MSYYQTLEEITAPDAGKHQKFKNIQKNLKNAHIF